MNLNGIRCAKSLLVVLAASCVFATESEYRTARREGALTRMRICLVDDLEMPVSNAAVNVVFGMNFRERARVVDGRTDERGLFEVQGKTCGDEIEIRATKDGYYSSCLKLCYAALGNEHKVKDGKWLPFDFEEKLHLRKIVSPIELTEMDSVVDVPRTNVWVGFDMKKCAFVHPFGDGEVSDFEAKVAWDGFPASSSQVCRAEIRFPTKSAGGFYFKNISESRFSGPMRVDQTRPFDVQTLAIVDRMGDPYLTRKPFPAGISLVSRTRCKTDPSGNVLSANYGSIRNVDIGTSRRGVATLFISYVFNPTPNDTNLEPMSYEAKRWLKKKLGKK